MPPCAFGGNIDIRQLVRGCTLYLPVQVERALLLWSLAVDLKISEIVDAGQYIVSALLPEAIFSG